MKLILKNFGAIKELEITSKPLMIFIGHQGTGKSTLAKLITILTNKAYQTFDSFKYALQYYNIDYALNMKNTFLHFEDEVFNWYLHFENGIYNFGNLVHSEQFITTDEKTKLEEFIKKFENNDTALSEFIKESKNAAESMLKLLEYFKGDMDKFQTAMNIQVLEQTKDKTVYIPAERILMSNISEYIFEFVKKDIDFPKCIIEFGAKFEKSRRELKEINVEFLNKVKYNYSKNEDVISVKGNKKLKLSQSSSGMQASVPLALVVSYYAPLTHVLFTIEEPELNLFPIAQKQLVHFLSKHCIKNNNQLIVTTHSPYIISAFANLIQAGNAAFSNPHLQNKLKKIISEEEWIDFEDVAAYYFDENNGTIKSILNYDNETIDGNIIDDASDIFADEFDKIMKIKYQN